MKNNIQGKGYNKGDTYEDKITKILINKKILSKNYKRAGASGDSDIQILIDNTKINIEIKADENADYGQKYLKWDKKNKWSWVLDDNVTKMYSKMNIIESYIDKDFIPKKFSKEKSKISNQDKKFDQLKFEKPDISDKCSLAYLFTG